MRTAFLGKGGSGKTTLAAAYIKYLAQKTGQVLAIDGDVNVHLSQTLLMDEKPLSDKESEVFQYFEGHRNIPLIGTTPPTNQSRFVQVNPQDPFLKKYSTQRDGINLITVGTYQIADIGASCYHGKLGVVEMLFHHLLDTENDWVVADFTAGIDSLGTSLFMIADLNIFVVEPTNKGVQVYQDFKQKSLQESITTMVVINKVIDMQDELFVADHFDPTEVLGVIKHSSLLHQFEQGDLEAFDLFVKENQEVFDHITHQVQKITRDWQTYYQRLVAIYQASCRQWYNDYYSQRLDEQIDQDFSYATVIKHHA